MTNDVGRRMGKELILSSGLPSRLRVCCDNNVPDTRPFPYGHGWFRTSDLSRVKRALSH